MWASDLALTGVAERDGAADEKGDSDEGVADVDGARDEGCELGAEDGGGAAAAVSNGVVLQSQALLGVLLAFSASRAAQ